MRSLVIALFAPVLAVSTARGQSNQPLRHVDVGASLGYALSIGSAEGGAPVSDTSNGIVPVELDAVYRLTHVVGLGAWFRYGPSIPTLCGTASECRHSLGSDIAVALRVRFSLPQLGPMRPVADAGVGYEWFASLLTDNGVTSTRAYRGPLLLTGSIAALFCLSERWSLGPIFGVGVGMFTNRSLEAPGVDQATAIREKSAHAWLTLGAHTTVSF
jgi:hypothetical protein